MNPSTAPEPRRHHYVPKFLLKGFAFERKRGKFQTQVFDKQVEKTFTSPIEDVMVEGDFNALETDGERISLESYIGSFEDIAAPLIERVLRGGSIAALNEVERLEIARFVALQFIRGTGHRALFDDGARKMAAEIERRGFSIPEDFEFSPDQIKAHGLLAITKSLPEYASHMASKDMVLFRAPEGVEFILGDNPVALRNQERTGFWGNLGLACQGIEIYLPLSAEYALALWCPSIRERFMGTLKRSRTRFGTLKAYAVLAARPAPIPAATLREYEEVQERLAPLERVFAKGEPYLSSVENVVHLNSLQVMHAERFIISKAGEFDLAREMLAKDDSYRQGRRMTVS